MKTILPLIILLCLLNGCTKESFTGSGTLISEKREVTQFNKVHSEGTFQVEIIKGTEQGVTITADDNIIHQVRTSVSEGELHLYLPNGNYQNIHVSATITVTGLEEVENSGTGDIAVRNHFNAAAFRVKNSGSGSISLEGNCTDLDLLNDGSGRIHAYNMETISGKVNTIGSGDVEISCIATLDVNIEGSGNVYYKGTPEIKIHTEGSGKLIPMN